MSSHHHHHHHHQTSSQYHPSDTAIFSDIVAKCASNQKLREYLNDLKGLSDTELKTRYTADKSAQKYSTYTNYINSIINFKIKGNYDCISEDEYRKMLELGVKQCKASAIYVLVFVLLLTGMISSLIVKSVLRIACIIAVVIYLNKEKSNLQDENWILEGYNTYLDIDDIASRLIV
jgi:hypothetical protein